MFTLISCPKNFDKPLTKIHQHNAIRSWSLVHPDVEIILCGDEKGVAEAASMHQTEHIPDVQLSNYGTPLLASVLSLGERAASNDRLVYLNADIILTSDFLAANSKVIEWQRSSALTGGRSDLEVNELINFDEGWEKDLRSRSGSAPQLREGMDYLVFSRGMIEAIPPFAIGRTTFDNWLIWNLRKHRIPLVDGSRAVLAIHQSHNSVSWNQVLDSPEVKLNQSLVSTWKRSYTLDDASHELIDGRVVSRRASAFAHRLGITRDLVVGAAKGLARPAYNKLRGNR